MARVTLQTIADRLGVSRMTVSNAFSRPDQLSAELRERVLATARELGYVGPDPAGRALARGTTGAVGVLLTDSLQYSFDDEVATAFMRAVVDELAPTGFALTLLTSHEREDVVPARDVAMDGALVYSCRPDSAARDWLLRRQLPVVFVDQDPVPGTTSINVDDPVATAVGHPQRQRMFGWLDALEAAGVRPTVVQAAANGDDEAIAAARMVLVAEPRPTAVLCFSDVLGLGVLTVAEELGLAVPDDLSVVGFDDSPVARRSRPPLTTVRQDVAAKGHLAAEALLKAIDHRRSGTKAAVRHRTIPTELVVRRSTGPARAE